MAGGGVLVVLVLLGAAILLVASQRASLTVDSTAIAKVTMPTGGGHVQSVTAVSGPQRRPVPVYIRDDKIWPQDLIPAGERLSIDVVVKRPGWIAWGGGGTERLQLDLVTPVASLRSHYLTVRAHQPLRLAFKQPVSAFAVGVAGHLRRRVLASPQSVITLPRTSDAGTVFVSAAPRTWERATQAAVSYFPAGSASSALAQPAPGTTIKPNTPITLTFASTVGKALGAHRPPVAPTNEGTWHTVNSHTIVFEPTGYGYGLGAHVQIPLPDGVKLVGEPGPNPSSGTWTVPAGSTVRLQQLLSLLGYLPLKLRYARGGVGLSPTDQETAAIEPPKAKFTWRYPNTPSWLVGDWQPGSYGEVTKAAVMAFETTEGMTADGVDGPQVWRALINAVVHGQQNTFGYTVVDVSEGSPESEATWHNGKTVVSGPVNTGIPATPTAQGTFAVFEHLTVTTMSGTNADGSTYVDPGIPDVSYFNGGDALHGFARASYGSPQSDGCVEMPYGEAASVFPYTPVGTLVNVT